MALPGMQTCHLWDPRSKIYVFFTSTCSTSHGCCPSSLAMRPVDVAQCSVEVFLSILPTERLQHIDCKEVSEIECRWLQSIAIACNHLSIWDPRSKIQDAMGVLDLKSWIHHLFLWDPGIQDPRSKMPWGSWIWNLGSILDPWIQDFKSFHCSHVLPCPKSCQAGHLTTRCQQFVTLKPCYSSVCEVASKSSARTETLCFPPWWLAKTGVGNATPGQALLKPYQKVPNSSSDRGSVVWQFATNLVDHWSHLSQIQASWSINSSKASSSVTVLSFVSIAFPFCCCIHWNASSKDLSSSSFEWFLAWLWTLNCKLPLGACTWALHNCSALLHVTPLQGFIGT